MKRDFVIADLHLGHQRLIDGWPDKNGVTVPNGGPRGQFRDPSEMWETIRDNARRVLEPRDKLWILGDIAMNNTSLRLLEELPFDLFAVLGNHDQSQPSVYSDVFKRVYGAVSKDGILLTHIPVHPCALNRSSMQINVHGHLHEDVVATSGEPDHRYVCVSCEQVNYTPVALDAIWQTAEERGLLKGPEMWERPPAKDASTINHNYTNGTK